MSIFFEDFNVLLDNKYRYDILPNKTINLNESVNATVRFAFYLSIVLIIIMKDIYFIGLFFIVAVACYIYYTVKVNKVSERYSDIKSKEDNKIEKQLVESLPKCQISIKKEPYRIHDIKTTYKNVLDLSDDDKNALKQYYTQLMSVKLPEFRNIDDYIQRTKGSKEVDKYDFIKGLDTYSKINIIQNQVDNSINRNIFVNIYLNNLDPHKDHKIYFSNKVRIGLDYDNIAVQSKDDSSYGGLCIQDKYFINEDSSIGIRSGLEANTCYNDCDCDGERICLDGTCSGEARSEDFYKTYCLNKNYFIDESATFSAKNYKRDGLSPSECNDNCDCDGERECIDGTCSGEARNPTDCSSADYVINEYSSNSERKGLDDNECKDNCDCDGKRICMDINEDNGIGKCSTGQARDITRQYDNKQDAVDSTSIIESGELTNNNAKNIFPSIESALGWDSKCGTQPSNILPESRKHRRSIIDISNTELRDYITKGELFHEINKKYQINLNRSKYKDINFASIIYDMYKTYVIIDSNKIDETYDIWWNKVKNTCTKHSECESEICDVDGKCVGPDIFLNIPNYKRDIDGTIVTNSVSLENIFDTYPFKREFLDIKYNCSFEEMLKQRSTYKVPKRDDCGFNNYLNNNKLPLSGGSICDYVKRGKIFMEEGCKPDRQFTHESFNVEEEKITCGNNIESVDINNLNNVSEYKGTYRRPVILKLKKVKNDILKKELHNLKN
tara:strand:+ start:1758 stop:3941 length:2184 start_codon:yes stop_codon:yes gene_type:complete